MDHANVLFPNEESNSHDVYHTNSRYYFESTNEVNQDHRAAGFLMIYEGDPFQVTLGFSISGSFFGPFFGSIFDFILCYRS